MEGTGDGKEGGRLCQSKDTQQPQHTMVSHLSRTLTWAPCIGRAFSAGADLPQLPFPSHTHTHPPHIHTHTQECIKTLSP